MRRKRTSFHQSGQVHVIPTYFLLSSRSKMFNRQYNFFQKLWISLVLVSSRHMRFVTLQSRDIWFIANHQTKLKNTLARFCTTYCNIPFFLGFHRGSRDLPARSGLFMQRFLSPAISFWNPWVMISHCDSPVVSIEFCCVISSPLIIFP